MGDTAIQLPASYLGCDDATTLFPPAAMKQLLANGKQIAETGDDNLPPVVKLFTPWGDCTWLIVSVEPDRPDIAYGLCDLGMGSPELGSVGVVDLTTTKGPFGLSIERDLHFTATKSIGDYADQARVERTINA